MHCLYQLDLESLNILIEDTLSINNWWIYNESLNERLNKIRDKDYFKILKNQAKRKNIKCNDVEIVSWLDTLNLLYFSVNNSSDKIKDNITIFQEFCIPLSNKRADYVLAYKNNLLIIEFSFNKLGTEYNYEKKLTQAIGYKELLSNLLDKNIKIGTYTFLVEPETEDGKRIFIPSKYKSENVFPNYDKTIDLANYIDIFFKIDNKTALEALADISRQCG